MKTTTTTTATAVDVSIIMNADNLTTLFGIPSSPVRTLTSLQGEPWFCAEDICKALDIANPHQALVEVACEDKDLQNFYTDGEVEEFAVVTEMGMYELIFQSEKPEAQTFSMAVEQGYLPEIVDATAEAIAKIIDEASIEVTGITYAEAGEGPVICDWLMMSPQMFLNLHNFISRARAVLSSEDAGASAKCAVSADLETTLALIERLDQHHVEAERVLRDLHAHLGRTENANEIKARLDASMLLTLLETAGI